MFLLPVIWLPNPNSAFTVVDLACNAKDILLSM